MDKEFLSKLDHDLSYRPGIIREALECGVEFGSKEFFVYSQLRWYETDGKFGWCVAGIDAIAEKVGLTPKEVTDALDRLNKKGLVQHIWCDKRVYRNKTKLWVSTVRLAQACTNVDAIKVLEKGRKNLKMLGQTTCENVETTCENVGATPVTTEVGNTNINTNINTTSKEELGRDKSLPHSIFDENKEGFTAKKSSTVSSSRSRVCDLTDTDLDGLIKEVLTEAGFSVCNTNVNAAKPSAKQALKSGVSKDKLIKAAKAVKEFGEEGFRSARSPFQSVDYWSALYDKNHPQMYVEKGSWADIAKEMLRKDEDGKVE